MKLSIRGLSCSFALIWGGAILCAGLAHLAYPGYASSFLNGVSSIYPGFHGGRSFADVVVGTLYALVDGAVGGVIFGWLYNAFSGQAAASHRSAEPVMHANS